MDGGRSYVPSRDRTCRERARAPRRDASRTRQCAAEAVVALFADAFEDALRSVHDARCGDALAKVGDEGARGEAARIVGAVDAAG